MTTPDTSLSTVRSFVEQFIRLAHFSGRIDIQERMRGDTPEAVVTVRLEEDPEILIGKNGQSLDALEHVARLLGVRQNQARYVITLDINDYRKLRLESITALARQTAERVRSSGRPETLAPMSASERREVHTILAEYSDLATESIGVEPMRRVVVKPASPTTP